MVADSIYLLLVSPSFQFLLGSILVCFMFLGMHPFLPSYPIYWYLIVDNSFLITFHVSPGIRKIMFLPNHMSQSLPAPLLRNQFCIRADGRASNHLAFFSFPPMSWAPLSLSHCPGQTLWTSSLSIVWTS